MNPDSPVVTSLVSLARSRRRHVRGIAIAGIVALLVTAAGVLAAIDLRAEWTPAVRIVLVATVLIAAIGLLLKWLARSRRHDAMEAARTIEAAHPEMGQKLRTALEVSGLPTTRTSRDAALFSQRLLDETTRELKATPWPKLVPRKTLWKRRGLALGALLAVGLLAILSDDFRFALKRILQPTSAATYTRVEWKSLPERFDDAHPPRLEFEVKGRNAQPQLLIRDRGGVWKPVELTRRTDGRTWDVVLPGKTRDLQFKVLAGDAASPEQTIAYQPVPKLIDSSAAIAYPAYTGLEAEQVAGGDIRTLEDSTASWRFVFNTPPARVAWSIAGAPAVDLTAPAGTANYPASAVINAGRSQGELSIYDAAGERIDSWRFEIEGIVDKLPQVEIVEPAKDLELISTAEMPVRIRAKDDFGIAELGLILDAGGDRQWILETVIDAKNKRQVSDIASMMLEKFQLKITDNVRLHAYALDHKPRGGPRAVSKLVSIDIKQFQMRTVNGLRDGGGGAGPKVDPEVVTDALKKLDQIIGSQRGILSDIFGTKESYRSQLDGEATSKAAGYSTREKELATEAHTVSNQWLASANIPEEDVMLMSTATEQMNEAAAFLAVPDLAAGFTSADRALSTLLQLRKELITLLSRSPSPNPKPMEHPPIPLAELAKEARRLAAEEQDVGSQITPEAIAGNGIAASRRQQEVAFADTGELYAKLVDHPERTEGALLLMDDAEKAVARADAAIQTSEPQSAAADLVTAGRQLLDLATFLESMELQKLADTLAKLAEEAEKSARKQQEEAAKNEGQSPGEKASGKSESSSKGEAAAQAAKATGLAGKILDELAKKAAPDPNEEQAEKSPVANALEGLAKSTDPDALAEDLEKLSQLQKQGDGEAAGKLGKEAAGRLGALAREYREAAAKLNASRLAELNQAREMAGALKTELARKEEGAGKGEGPKPGEDGKGDSAAKTGEGEGKGEGEKPGPGKDGQQSQPGGTGPSLHRFADTLKDLGDETGLGRMVIPLHKAPFDRSTVPLVDAADQRLQELIEQMPNDRNIATARGKLPEQSRREIEDYFRDLSDDFGGEVWESKQ